MTLLETIVMFALFLTIISLLPNMFYFFIVADERKIKEEEFQLFVLQLQSEFRRSEQYHVNDSQTMLYLYRSREGSDVDLIEYEKYAHIVRRRVNGSGHELFLNQVHDFYVEESEIGILIKVESLNGIKYEAYLTHPKTLLNAKNRSNLNEGE